MKTNKNALNLGQCHSMDGIMEILNRHVQRFHGSRGDSAMISLMRRLKRLVKILLSPHFVETAEDVAVMVSDQESARHSDQDWAHKMSRDLGLPKPSLEQ